MKSRRSRPWSEQGHFAELCGRFRDPFKAPFDRIIGFAIFLEGLHASGIAENRLRVVDDVPQPARSFVRRQRPGPCQFPLEAVFCGQAPRSHPPCRQGKPPFAHPS
jgi:hypothetical protein